MPSLKPLEESLAHSWSPAAWADVSVLLAVSGGADSVALLRAMATLKSDALGRGQLLIAHFNHSLRGAESDQDQQQVIAVCEALDLPCHVGQANVRDLAQQQGDGLEAAARDARYDFLTRTAERLGARYVVTAHTREDQVETILHRIVRGTGLSGAAGVPRVRSLSPVVTLIRPFLTTTRAEIEAYLQSLNQPYRDDPSNTDRAFTRNRIRHELLPLLREGYNANVDQAILRLGILAGQAQSIIEDLADDLLQRALLDRTLLDGALSDGALLDQSAQAGDVMSIALVANAFANQPRYLVREAIKRAWQAARWPQQAMGYESWDQLTSLATNRPEERTETRIVLPGNIQVLRNDERLLLTRSL